MTAARSSRLGSAWFLGAVFCAFLVFAWLRGAGRLLIPLLLLGGLAWFVHRLVRAVRAPVD